MEWQEDPSGVRVSYEYDLSGNVTEVRDESGVVTTYEYDGRNLPVAMYGNDNQVYEYRYDADGRKIAEIAPSINGTSGSQNTYQWVYDEAGRLSREIDRLGNEQIYGNRQFTPTL